MKYKIFNFLEYFNSLLLLGISFFMLWASYLALKSIAIFIWVMGFIAFGCIQHLVGKFKKRFTKDKKEVKE